VEGVEIEVIVCLEDIAAQSPSSLAEPGERRDPLLRWHPNRIERDASPGVECPVDLLDRSAFGLETEQQRPSPARDRQDEHRE
jgi:hypothetical protein